MTEKAQFEYLWDKIRERLEKLVTHITFETYFKNLEATDIVNKKIVLKAASETGAGIVMRNADKLREAIAAAQVGLNDFIVFVEGSSQYTVDELPDALEENPLQTDKRFTFDSYVVGTSNRLVYAAAKSVASAPGENFNPLYIYGGTGLGKTHLLQAIANEIASQKPSLKVLYTTSEKFLNEFVDSLSRSGEGQIARFRSRYRNVDVLLIDDVQFWAGKSGVQEEFFHTFNELFSQNKQIVITSDCPAKDLKLLEERLRTRFEGGLIADVQPPDIETKIAILKKKAYERKAVVPDEVLAFLIKSTDDDNVRTLEGRLNTVIFASKLHEQPISLELAALALQESINVSEPGEVTPGAIIRATCAHYGITQQELLSKNKKAEIARARQICAYLMRDMLSMPLVNIGQEMGGMHYSTIIYAHDKIAELMKVNDKIAKDVSDIRSVVLKQ